VRIGHYRLNQYLSRIGVVDEVRYSCRYDEETTRNLLLAYPRWTEKRRELRKSVGDRSGDVFYVLGGLGSKKDIRTR
jgi:hypothetical protein